MGYFVLAGGFSFVAQGANRIDIGRVEGRQPAGDEANAEQDGNRAQCRRIDHIDAIRARFRMVTPDFHDLATARLVPA